jgi:hypothetical protein
MSALREIPETVLIGGLLGYLVECMPQTDDLAPLRDGA